MKLRLPRRRVLRGIERDLATSDPRLAALFRTFTRLAQDEGMPRTEKLTARQRRMSSRPRRRAVRLRAGPHRAGEGWRAAVRAILCRPLACVTVACGSPRYTPGAGYPLL